MKKVLITGANGMVGCAIAHKLIDNYDLLLVDRCIDKLKNYSDRAKIIHSDLAEVVQWQDCLEDVYCVVHLAAVVHGNPVENKKKRDFFQINAEATRELYKCCVEHNVKRFLFFSTNDVYAASSQVIYEDTSTQPQGIYGTSKLLAERYLFEASDDRTAICIFRPASIFGPNDLGSMRTLVNLCSKGIVPMIGAGTNKKALLYVKDIVQSVERYLKSDDPLREEIINISSGDFEYREIIDTVCAVYGYTPMRIHLPYWFCTKVASRLTPLRRLSVAAENKTISNDKARDLLCYSAEYSLYDGLKDAKDYYIGELC